MYIDVSTINSSSYPYYKGISSVVGNGTQRAVLPPQAIPKHKKNKDWEKMCLDGLEREGLKQYRENLPLKDYYDMLSGDMVYCDIIGEEVDVLFKSLNIIKKEYNIPHYVRHYDLMYPIVQKFVGEWLMNAIKLRFDSIDEVSTNDYIREKTQRLHKYTKAHFQQQLDKLLVQNGFNPSVQFSSEEEQQAYEQERQRIIEENFPDNIEQDMRKNWKTDFANWCENVYGRDSFRFRMSNLYMLEAINILLTGKAPRHYRVGYDYYYPEHWHPIETFHSKEVSVTRFEDCEFAGRIKYYTLTELINTYGDYLNEKQRIALYKSFYGPEYQEYGDSYTSFNSGSSFLNEKHFETINAPFRGYNDHRMALEIEEVTGIPLSETTDLKTGEKRPSYSMPLYTPHISVGHELYSNLRNDFEVRTDTLQVTEAYWKGVKRIGVMTYRTSNGYLSTIEVDEDILPEVKEEYKIRNLRKVSLREYDVLKDEDKENTIIWIDVPIVYKGIKINCQGLYNAEDIYFVEELPFTIKGEKGNMFDVKLPVCGHIGESFCKKIRGEQIEYNYLLNQNQGYRERELGSFFVFDVAGTPDDVMDLGEGREKITTLFNIARSTGIMPVDMSRNNLNQNGGAPPFNPNGIFNLTFTEAILRNEEMAQRTKLRAYEKIGLSPQAMGAVSQYSTVEGIQMGQRATLAQTYNIEKIFLDNYSQGAEVHLAVAQYCQLNNKDANYIYMAGDSELRFLQSIKDDENFPYRQIAVRPLTDPAKLRELKEIKQLLISNNTMGADAKGLTDIYWSDDVMELRQMTENLRVHMEKLQKQKMEHEEKMKTMELEQDMVKFKEEIRVKDERNDATVQSAHLRSLGQAAARSDTNDGMEIIDREFNEHMKTKQEEHKQQMDISNLEKEIFNIKSNISNKAKELELKARELDIKEKQIDVNKYMAERKNFDSLVNKN